MARVLRSSRALKFCHPERSSVIREANYTAKSKDRSAVDIIRTVAGSSPKTFDGVPFAIR
jgi:hypothetical protein